MKLNSPAALAYGRALHQVLGDWEKVRECGTYDPVSDTIKLNLPEDKAEEVRALARKIMEGKR